METTGILLTPYEVALVSELQVEACGAARIRGPSAFTYNSAAVAGRPATAFEARVNGADGGARCSGSGDQPTEADARAHARRFRVSFSSPFDCGWSRPRSPGDGGVRGDGVLTSTTPPRAVVTVASTPSTRRSSSSTARTRRTSTRASCPGPCPSGPSPQILPWRRPST